MSLRTGILLMLFAVQACSSGGIDCESSEFQAHSAALDGSVGARSADDYFALLRIPIDSCEAKYQRMLFIESFFEGYRAGGTIYGEPSALLRAMQAGMAAGEEYRLANPELAVATYASFGYTQITVEGVWTVAFEHSGFAPAKGYQGERWWLELLPDLASRLPDGLVPEGGLAVRITGYLSRLGQYGHMNGYQRLMYAEDVTVVNIDQQSVAADRPRTGAG